MNAIKANDVANIVNRNGMPESIKDLPVTTIVRLKPKRGMREEMLAWYHSGSQKAASYKGLLSTEIFEAVKGGTQSEFAIIFQFDTYENLKVWVNSKEKEEQIVEGKTLFDEVKPKIQLSGIEYWFEPKAAKNPNTAPRWKMMIVTVVLIFTLLNTLMPVIVTLIKYLGMPAPLTMLLRIIIMVTLMTYLVMPFATKVLGGWLFGKK